MQTLRRTRGRLTAAYPTGRRRRVRPTSTDCTRNEGRVGHGSGALGAELGADEWCTAPVPWGVADPTSPAPSRALLWRVARTPRMLGMLALLLAAAVVCGLLGAWQLDRAQVRGAAAEERRRTELAAAEPVPLESVLAPQTSFTGALVGRKVEVTGTYEAAGQLLVTGRAHDGVTGVLVLTPLRVRTADGGRCCPWCAAGSPTARRRRRRRRAR